MKPSTDRAVAEVHAAMDRVQAAQTELSRACQHLSTLRYGADIYAKASKLYDQVHSFWYKLDSAAKTRGRMTHHDEAPND